MGREFYLYVEFQLYDSSVRKWYWSDGQNVRSVEYLYELSAANAFPAFIGRYLIVLHSAGFVGGRTINVVIPQWNRRGDILHLVS
ncbi:MAG: hypothetical protein AAFN93_17470 [Bacteroidota bacterium]